MIGLILATVPSGIACRANLGENNDIAAFGSAFVCGGFPLILVQAVLIERHTHALTVGACTLARKLNRTQSKEEMSKYG